MPNNNKKNRRDDSKIILWIIVAFLFVAWFCSPPGNKFLQMCFWGNNTKLFFAKVFQNQEATEYMFYRNNAVYIAKMFPNDKRKAMREINKAINMAPSYISDKKMQELYKDRAYIELYYRDYTASLNDFLRSGELSMQDYLPVALLLTKNGNYKQAMSYCNSILDIDYTAYGGYACLSEVYKAVNRPDLAIKIWDYAIDKKPNNAKFYYERSKVKAIMGNQEGHDFDALKAKEFGMSSNYTQSIVDDILQPKILCLTIK